MNATERDNARLMRKAGFKILYDMNDSTVWGRGELRIATGPLRMTLERLVSHVIDQTIYRVQRHTKQVFEKFPIDNE